MHGLAWGVGATKPAAHCEWLPRSFQGLPHRKCGHLVSILQALHSTMRSWRATCGVALRMQYDALPQTLNIKP